MEKMKKTHSIFLLLAGLFIFSLSSCIDSSYDLDDLDKKAVFSPDGIDIPVGNLERIWLAEEIRKSYNGEVFGTGDEVLYIKYGDIFPATMPTYEMPDMEDVVVENTISLLINASVSPSKLDLISNETFVYKLNETEFDDEEKWDVELKQINFAAFVIDIQLDLSEMSFGETGKADYLLTVDFPSSYQLLGGNRIEKTINVRDFKNGSYVLKGIQIQSYNYASNEENVSYSLALNVTEDIQVTTTNPVFQMKIIVDNENVMINSLACSLKGSEDFIDKVTDFEDFNEAFGNKNNYFEFKDLFVEFSVKTNLGTDFTTKINGISADNQAPISLEEPLIFDKPSPLGTLNPKTTAYVLSANRPENVNEKDWRNFDITKLITSVPKAINYDITLNFDDENALLLYQGTVFDAEYEMKIPFDFTDLRLNVENRVADLFNEDLYDQLFKYAEGNLSIQADLVDIVVGEEMEIVLQAKILGANNQDLGVNIEPITLKQGTNIEKFALEIKNEDMEKMKNAKHLEFVFTLIGKGALTGNDYIDIQKIRIVSDGGINFEL
jgi:hypothetical protein